MKVLSCISALIAVLLLYVATTDAAPAPYSYKCSEMSPCAGETLICPEECPSLFSNDLKAKVCYLSCGAPKCRSECRHRKPNCDSPGSACYDPRFIGADGIVFYFHGKSNEHFSLVSDRRLQINARFIGHRPAGRSRDFTWIQALGLLFNSHSFTLEATKAATWDDNVDHLKFTYDGQEIIVPKGALSTWTPTEQNVVRVERTANKNSAIINIPGVVEILVNVVPVTKEDDKIHSYKVPSDDCFTHLEVQFRFSSLSPKVEGVLGRTYQPDFENPAKPGVAMPVVGGEDKYRTTSLVSADCENCIYSTTEAIGEVSQSNVEYSTLDCTSKMSRGNGIVCKK
ncbi:hypothetical protein ACH5RR_037713 [Cinchona calisaya]|uniref:Root cap n=1 Tax=Cinchona calisaya TaxID=153742 RepID=A0ABD2Y6Z3_9GENT